MVMLSADVPGGGVVVVPVTYSLRGAVTRAKRSLSI
jgi:hypothetical protein